MASHHSSTNNSSGQRVINSRIGGLDLLRAVMSIFVVIGHMRGGGTSLIFSPGGYKNHTVTFSDFVNFHLLLLAVPTFFLISNYLFAAKKPDFRYFVRFLARIFVLLVFWTGLLLLYWNGVYGFLQNAPKTIPGLIVTVLTAGNTQYWFFISLILCLSVTYISLRLHTVTVFLLFLLSSVFLAFMPYITMLMIFYPLSAYWNPLNFVPFSFSAILLVRFGEVVSVRRAIIALTALFLAVLFSFFEWQFYKDDIFFPGQGSAIPAYTRGSLLFSALAIFVLAISSKVRTNNAVYYLSKHSLALYCLHPFFMVPALSWGVILLGAGKLSQYLSIALVILCCYGLSSLYGVFIKNRIFNRIF